MKVGQKVYFISSDEDGRAIIVCGVVSQKTTKETEIERIESYCVRYGGGELLGLREEGILFDSVEELIKDLKRRIVL